jgi:hypothetical protein
MEREFPGGRHVLGRKLNKSTFGAAYRRLGNANGFGKLRLCCAVLETKHPQTFSVHLSPTGTDFFVAQTELLPANCIRGLGRGRSADEINQKLRSRWPSSRPNCPKSVSGAGTRHLHWHLRPAQSK